MDAYQYRGVMPHAVRVAPEHGADPAAVDQLKPVARLNGLLGQAVRHRNRGDLRAARDVLAECRSDVALLRSAYLAAEATYAEVATDAGIGHPDWQVHPATEAHQPEKPPDNPAPTDAGDDGEGFGADADARPPDSQDGNPEEIGHSDGGPHTIGGDPVHVEVPIDDPDALRDVIDHMDPPPEDDPPLGRKNRKR